MAIVIGLAFLLWNFGVRLPFMRYQNWWALFILIGAVGPLSYAVHRYREKGRLDSTAWHSLVSAAAIVFVALLFCSTSTGTCGGRDSSSSAGSTCWRATGGMILHRNSNFSAICEMNDARLIVIL